MRWAEAEFAIDRWPGLVRSKVFVGQRSADQVAEDLVRPARHIAGRGEIRLKYLTVDGLTRCLATP